MTIILPWAEFSWLIDEDCSACSIWLGVENTGGFWKCIKMFTIISITISWRIIICTRFLGLFRTLTYRYCTLIRISCIQMSICVCSRRRHLILLNVPHCRNISNMNNYKNSLQEFIETRFKLHSKFCFFIRYTNNFNIVVNVQYHYWVVH